MCTLLQWCFNEFNIVRIRYVSANLVVPQYGSVGVAQRSSTSIEPLTPTAMQPIPIETSTSRSLIDRMLSLFGERVSDEKYLERLKRERDSHLRRIAELEEKEKQ